MPSLKPHGQMSEAFITALFLSVSGGLQDVYTYLYRGKVFANAQTGNIVLMAVKLFAGEWGEALRYLMPLCAFALGIFVAEFIRLKLKRMQWLHWRQLVVLFEILMLFVVGFLPQELNLLANSLVSFSCAMQVQSFRKVNGYAFASTMCIGNLRRGNPCRCADCRCTWYWQTDSRVPCGRPVPAWRRQRIPMRWHPCPTRQGRTRPRTAVRSPPAAPAAASGRALPRASAGGCTPPPPHPAQRTARG